MVTGGETDQAYCRHGAPMISGQTVHAVGDERPDLNLTVLQTAHHHIHAQVEALDGVATLQSPLGNNIAPAPAGNHTPA